MAFLDDEVVISTRSSFVVVVVVLLYCCIVVAAISGISLFVINKMMSTYSEDSLGFSAES